jgi:photosystem II stability/assembly factor-like uncharacterized protein
MRNALVLLLLDSGAAIAQIHGAFGPAGDLTRHFGRRFVLAAAILLFAAATVAGAQWSEIGSGLPRTVPGVKSLAIDSATPSTLYAVDARGQLFKTIDSGGSWKLRGSVAGVSSVVVDPTNSSTVYAVTWPTIDGALQRGVLKSTDGGENWVGADSGLGGNSDTTTIAIDPLTPATLYAATSQGIFKSTDAARSWNKLDTLPPEADGTTHPSDGGITIDPVTPSTIYVDFNGGYSSQGILKSTDGGQSWNRLDSAPAISRNSLVVDPITSSTLYARSSKFDGNIFKSTDGGQTWTAHPAAPPGTAVLSLGIDPVSPSTLYAIYWSSPSNRVWGILKSTDSGENWSALDTGLPPYADPGYRFVGAIPVLAVSPTMPATVYTGYFISHPSEFPADGHLAKSADGGVTWNAADAGLSYVDVRAVAIDPAIPSKIYAGMGGAGSSIALFESADGGGTWSSLAQFELSDPGWYGWIGSLVVDSRNSSLIYAAANAGGSYGAVFKTKDGGANWIRTGLRAWTSTVMAMDPADSNTIYLGDYDGIEGDAWLDKSVDGGSTWTRSYFVHTSPGDAYVYTSRVNALVIDAGNRATLYAGTLFEGVFKSADGGANWSNIGLIGLGMGVTSLALDPGDPNTIYAGAYAFNAGLLGLFKSTDGGASWTPINNGLASVLDSRSTITAIAFDPGNPSTVYVATSGRGVYKSLDGGANWEPLNEGLTNLDVRLLAVASNALYAVTSSGIFKKID